MDFYDPIVEEASKDEIKTTSETNKNTEIAVERLENEIDHVYSLVESRFQTILNDEQTVKGKEILMKQLNSLKENANVSQNVEFIEKLLANFTSNLSQGYSLDKLTSQLNVINKKSLDDSFKDLSGKLSSIDIDSNLDALDSKLEIVERKGGEYLSQMSSFFSTLVSVQSENTNSESPEKELTFSPISSYKVYGASRYDNELFKLHTTASFYQDKELDFDVEAKTEEIADLLKKYPETLDKMMNYMVPVKVSYKSFWDCYFNQLKQIDESEKKRKELLNSVNEDDFSWDDDEEPTDTKKVEVKKVEPEAGEESEDDWE